jgi:GNAT superfamily N-acetyltransferase
VRRELYEEWLSEPHAFVLLAEVEGEPIGYALVHLRGPEETWETGERIGVLETLTVQPDERGRGIGSALFECIYAELRRLGVTELQVAVISKNAAALRFYERHGLLPFTVSFMGRVRD